MATPQGTNQFQYLVESMCRALAAGKQPDVEDFRRFCTHLQTNIQAVLPGGNWVTPGGTKSGGSAPPSGVALAVQGGNGAFNVGLTNPRAGVGVVAPVQPILHEISYSPLKSFTKGVTTLQPTTSTSVVINAPGESHFIRVRSSYDGVNWSPYQIAQGPTGKITAIDAGLVSSAATSDAGAFNQTNFGVVTSVAVGDTAEVSIQGPAGFGTGMTAQKGPVQSTLPSATVLGVKPGSDLFVGYNAATGSYSLHPTLAGVLQSDGRTPVGKVSVVNVGTPTLPVLTPIIQGGFLVGASFTPGNGLSGIPTFTVSGASGAVIVGTGVSGGQLQGVQVTNPGDGTLGGGTTITAAGGIGLGSAGGGTAVGGNGGRLTAV